MSGSNPLAAALSQVGQSSPFTVANNLADLSTKAQALKTSQFDLQQKQQGLAYDAMRRLAMTNPDPSMADVQEALGGATRMGGLSDPIISNITSAVARGGKLSDIVRSYATGGMSPENQVLIGVGTPVSVNTGAGTAFGTRGGVLSATPGGFTPSGFVQSTLTPEAATEMVQVGVNRDGSPNMVPRWQVSGSGAPGVGPAGVGAVTGAGPATSSGTPSVQGGGAGVGGSALLSPGAPDDVAAARIDQIGQRESGNRNIPTAIKNPDGSPASTASGPYQFLDSTWQQAAREYGIPNPTQRAMDTDPAIQRAVAIKFLQTHGEQPWATSAPGGGGGAVVAGAGRPQGGPFIGATSVRPVSPGGGAVQPAGGVQYFDPYGRPIQGGAGGQGGPPAGGYTGYTGLPAGFEQTVQPQIARANQLQQGLAAGIQTRATLEGMEAELNNLPATGVPSGPLGTLRNLAVSAGLVSQQTADSMARTQSAQEQFEKFASLLQQQQLGALTGQATDERQALTAASTPSILHTKLGNLGIIHMLEGNQSALQVMGRAWQQAVSSGQASPQQFDAWRNQFTEPDKNGGRFDPRVFWMAQMGADEQRRYGSTLTAKDQQQLKRNVQFAEQHGWVFANQDGSFGTSY